MHIKKGKGVVTRSTKGLVGLVEDIIIKYSTGRGVESYNGSGIVIKTDKGDEVLELPNMCFTRQEKRNFLNKQVEYSHSIIRELVDNRYRVKNEYTLLIYDSDGQVECEQFSHVDYMDKWKRN